MVICHNLKMEQNSGQVPRFSDLVDLQERFLDLTGSSGYGTSMALDVTTSEIEMRDLTIAVSVLLNYWHPGIFRALKWV
jgi:hypothetical protein